MSGQDDGRHAAHGYHRPMQIIDAAATRSALPFDRLVSALRERFAAGCETPPRHVHEIANPLGDAGGDAAARRMTSLLMPAWVPGKFYGVKIINIAPGNAKRGLPGLHGSYLLFDARTGVPLAHLDGDEITARRTAAAAALAGSYLAREDASHLLVVGAGRVAALLPAAWGAVRKLERVTVWARRGDEAEKLAQQWRAEGFNAQATSDLAAACGEARHRELRHAGHRAGGARRLAGAGLAPGPDRQLHARHARGGRRLL